MEPTPRHRSVTRSRPTTTAPAPQEDGRHRGKHRRDDVLRGQFNGLYYYADGPSMASPEYHGLRKHAAGTEAPSV